MASASTNSTDDNRQASCGCVMILTLLLLIFQVGRIVLISISPDAEPQSLTEDDQSMQDLQIQEDKIAESLGVYRSKQEHLQKTVIQLEKDYKDLDHELRQNDRDSPGARVIAKEMNELQLQLNACQSKQLVLDEAIVKMESILRRVQRYELLEDSTFTSDELDEINRAILEINISIESEYCSESEDLDIEAIFDTLDN